MQTAEEDGKILCRGLSVPKPKALPTLARREQRARLREKAET